MCAAGSGSPDAGARARAARAAIGVAVALILCRAAIWLAYEQVDFDSDQAIVGLMAKHLSERRAFPLFFYGQHYMLGVQSWIAVPFFWTGGPTLAMLRLPLAIINCGVAALVIAMLVRRGARPLAAFAAALPLVVMTPVVSSAMFETLGASIEPFLYVIALWTLRRQPLAFGALLCVGTLHREFTILAVPAIAAVTWLEARSVDLRHVAKMAIGFIGVWLAIDALKRHVSLLGPGGGAGTTGPLLEEAVVIGRWLSFRADDYLARLHAALTEGLPLLLGGTRYALRAYSVNSSLTAGGALAGAALGAAVVLALARLAWLASTGRVPRDRLHAASFPLYLALVGMGVFAVYGLNGGIDPHGPIIVRYLLFALFVPVAVLGGYFLLEPSPAWPLGVVSLVMIWGAMTAADTVRLFREYRVAAPPNEFRLLVDYLIERRVKYGRAQYWDAYAVDFLSRERVLLASTGEVRIAAYQSRVAENASNAATIERAPCDRGTRVASWCVIDPFDRR